MSTCTARDSLDPSPEADLNQKGKRSLVIEGGSMSWLYQLSAFVFFANLALNFQAVAQTARVKFISSSGTPVANAHVLIGLKPGEPFSGNELTTSQTGEIEIPAAWSAATSLSIESSSHVRTTYSQVSPRAQTLKISEADGTEKIEIKGQLVDFGKLRTDGKLDVGAFVPTFSRSELLYFDVGWMVSPEVDTFTVVGRDVAIPSNITLPKQEESYIFPITFNKPEFRMFVRKTGHYRFLAIHGQFPLQMVVDDMRAGKPAYEIINYGSLIESGRVDLEVTGPVHDLKVSVTGLPFVSSMAVRAPTLSSDDVMLTVALTEDREDSVLVPSDVKRMKSGQVVNLKIPSTTSPPLAVSVLLKEKRRNVQVNQVSPLSPEDVLKIPFDILYEFFNTAATQEPLVDFRQFSLATHPANGGAPQFLGLIPAPQVNGSDIHAKAPTTLGSIEPLATLLIYSGIKYHGSGQLRTESRTRLWEVWQSGWSEDFHLPDLSQINTGNFDKRRWEVIYLGRDNSLIPGRESTDISHVTRNAIDF